MIFCTNILVLLAQLHQYIAGKVLASVIGEQSTQGLFLVGQDPTGGLIDSRACLTLSRRRVALPSLNFGDF
jgi:hypothetical protein